MKNSQFELEDQLKDQKNNQIKYIQKLCLEIIDKAINPREKYNIIKYKEVNDETEGLNEEKSDLKKLRKFLLKIENKDI